MKVFLVFPPQWTPAMPHLALPVLTAYLRSHGVEVVQRDLNMETYDTILSRAYLEQALDRLHVDYPGVNGKSIPRQVRWAFEQGPQLANQIKRAKAVFHSPAFYDGEKSFDAFVNALSQASVTEREGVLTFESPSVGRFVTGWDARPTVNGEPIQLSRYPLVDSAWAHSDFGSGEMVLRYGDEIYELWFNQ